ncbi:unnamed protein product, partial [Symbiodinium pilosum]
LHSDRMLELQGHKLVNCVAEEDEKSRAVEKDDVKDYMPWAILSTFFCPILGGVSIYQSTQVKAYQKKKDYKKARAASRRTTVWGLYALMLGVVIIGSFTTIYITNGRVRADVGGDDGDDGDDGGYGDAADGDATDVTE